MSTVAPAKPTNIVQAKVRALVANPKFEWFILGVIVFNSILLGLETSKTFTSKFGYTLELINDVVLWIFVAEIALKWIALAPRIQDYFKNGWNVFDFIIVALAFLPTGGSWAAIARMARILRVMRLISAVPNLRMIVQTLLQSIPSMLNVLWLLLAIFYVYAILGYHLFHHHDPTHWETLGMSLLTLFRVVTLEDWTDVMYKAMEISPYMCIYFVSFVVVGTFVFMNLFIAVMLKNAENIHEEETADIEDVRRDVAELKALLETHLEQTNAINKEKV